MVAKPARVVLVVGLTALAVGLLGLPVLRPWWQTFAPEAAQVPVGLVALALGGAVFLWLRQAPRPTAVRGRRRGRLRDRYPRNMGQDNDDGA